MKKNKKLLTSVALGLGTLASVAAPIAAVVSCGSGEDYSKVVVLKSTFSKGGVQEKTIQTLVDYYNKNIVGKKAGYDFPVKMIHVEGGYGTATDTDIMDIKQGNMNPVSDIIVDYPDSAGKLLDKALDFGKLDPSLKAQFDPAFTTTEYATRTDAQSSATTTTPDSLKALPLAKSSEMISFDIPLLATLVDENYVTLETNSELSKAVTAYKSGPGAAIAKDETLSSYEKEKAAIKKIWPQLTTRGTSPVTINDATMQSYDTLFAATKALGDKLGVNVRDANNHIAADDAPTNLLYQVDNALGGFDKDKFIFGLDNGLMKYDGIINKSSDKGKNLNAALVKINGYVKGGLVLNGSGAYASDDLTKHHLLFAIGSTAGYSHNYSKYGSSTLKGTGANDPIITNTYSAKQVVGGSGKTVATTNDKYKNKYLESTETASSKYDTVLKDAQAGTKLSALLKGLTGNQKVYISDDKDAKNQTGAVQITDKKYAFVGIKQTFGTDTTLQQNELGVMKAPHKTTDSDAKVQYLSQGPSIIGIEHGGAKDIQTGKFVSWLMSTDKVDLNGKGLIRPIEFFDNEASYITPFKGAFAGLSKFTSPDDQGNNVAFETFKEISTVNSGIAGSAVAFDNPVSNKTGAIRKGFDSNVKSIYTNFHQGTPKSDDDLFALAIKSISL